MNFIRKKDPFEAMDIGVDKTVIRLNEKLKKREEHILKIRKNWWERIKYLWRFFRDKYNDNDELMFTITYTDKNKNEFIFRYQQEMNAVLNDKLDSLEIVIIMNGLYVSAKHNCKLLNPNYEKEVIHNDIHAIIKWVEENAKIR